MLDRDTMADKSNITSSRSEKKSFLQCLKKAKDMSDDSELSVCIERTEEIME